MDSIGISADKITLMEGVLFLIDHEKLYSLLHTTPLLKSYYLIVIILSSRTKSHLMNALNESLLVVGNEEDDGEDGGENEDGNGNGNGSTPLTLHVAKIITSLLQFIMILTHTNSHTSIHTHIDLYQRLYCMDFFVIATISEFNFEESSQLISNLPSLLNQDDVLNLSIQAITSSFSQFLFQTICTIHSQFRFEDLCSICNISSSFLLDEIGWMNYFLSFLSIS